MKTIDCILIGHNEMDFSNYEASVRQMGENSGAYRDLNLSFIRHNGVPYPAGEAFNRFYNGNGSDAAPLRFLESFSATIAYLGTYLHRRGFSFDFIHSFREEKAKLAEMLENNEVLTAAITTTYYVSIFPIFEIIDFIRRHNKTVRIIIGGPFISNQVRTQTGMEIDFLLQSLDADFYVNSSQGETALVNIIEALKSGSSFNAIHNIYYKNVYNKYKSTPVKEENNRLEENTVDWRLFANRLDRFVNIRSAISCPFSCAFCGSPKHAGIYQTVGPDKIEEELNLLHSIESVKNIHFVEDTLNLPVKRFKEILRRMIKNKYRFSWHSYLRGQYVDRETVELLKESNCRGVYLGLESGNDQILENMNKNVRVEQYLKGISLLKEYDILMHGNFILGFPGETEDTVRETISFIKESGIDFFRVQLWYCMPITPIWEQREHYKISGKSFEWTHATMDSKTAADWIEKMFISIRRPVWTPQYNFDINQLVHLLERGLDPAQVKDFLNAFNDGIREKLTGGGQDISAAVLRRLSRVQPETVN
jgi:radical SAM PhpK family P-methyltransferase